jgi:hypothetical protein
MSIDEETRALIKKRQETSSISDEAVEEYERFLQSANKHSHREIDEKIYKKIAKEASIPVQMSWLPTKTARASFFSPIADQDLKGGFTDITFKSRWGTVKVEGPPLNIADEGVFLALLYLVKKSRNTRIQMNYKRICEVLGVTYQTKNRRKIKASIKKLSKTSLDYEMKDGSWSVKRILSDASGDKEFVIVEVDPWFFKKYLVNEITSINMDFRRSIRGDITKCLYRFLNSHRGVGTYHIDTLISALNMNPNQELKENRRALKSAFTQLKTKKFLTHQFKDDVFFNIKIKK